MGRLNQFEVAFARPKVFYAGQQVAGDVIIGLTEPVKINSEYSWVLFIQWCTLQRVHQPIITARKRSYGKVMFSHLSVILFTRGGGSMCDVWGRHAWRRGLCVVKGSMWGKGVGVMPGRGRGAYVQEERPLKRAVRILLEYILIWPTIF